MAGALAVRDNDYVRKDRVMWTCVHHRHSTARPRV